MKGNLLIIDDETVLLKSMRNLLEDMADEIYTSENGQDGLAIIREKTIHCIVCDINMPIMNGVELIKRIREEKFDVPFIFYTGHGNRELMLEAAKYGAFDFLNKPSLDGLEEIVGKALARGTNTEEKMEAEYTSEYAKMLQELDKIP